MSDLITQPGVSASPPFLPRNVHREALDEVLAQALRGPLAELRASVRAATIADGDDDVVVVVFDEAVNLRGTMV